MFWQIGSFPRCQYHVFLSDCAADRHALVYPVYERLMGRGIIPWLDRENYYYGRGSRTALRDGLLRSRHVVYFITYGMLEYRRGWCQMELAYSDLLQSNLVHPGGPLLNLELPLMFLDRTDSELPRTVWEELRDRARFHHPSDGDAVAWAVKEVTSFLHREQDLSVDMAKLIVPGESFHASLTNRPGLVERVTQFDPGPIP